MRCRITNCNNHGSAGNGGFCNACIRQASLAHTEEETSKLPKELMDTVGHIRGYSEAMARERAVLKPLIDFITDEILMSPPVPERDEGTEAADGEARRVWAKRANTPAPLLPHLLLGSRVHAINYRSLCELGISTVITCYPCTTWDNPDDANGESATYRKHNIVRHILPAQDDPNYHLLDLHLADFLSLIDTGSRKGSHDFAQQQGPSGQTRLRESSSGLFAMTPCQPCQRHLIASGFFELCPTRGVPVYRRSKGVVSPTPESVNNQPLFHETSCCCDGSSGRSRVLAHCLAGVNRSAALVCAYVTLHTGCSVFDAIRYVFARRGTYILNNAGFVRQLCRLAVRSDRLGVEGETLLQGPENVKIAKAIVEEVEKCAAAIADQKQKIKTQ